MLKILLLVGLCFVVASAKSFNPKEIAYKKFSLGYSFPRIVYLRRELLELNFTDFKEYIENYPVSFKRYEGKCVFIGFYGPCLDAEIRGGKLPLKRF